VIKIHRTEGANADSSTGKNLFTDGPPGTTLESGMANALQEEISNVIESAGMTLNTRENDTRDQLDAAILLRIAQNATALRDTHRGLVIVNTSGFATTKMDIDADEINLQDSNSQPVKVSSVNLTVDITASGVNGLDTGSEAVSTWYFLWVIYNISTETTAGLLSASDSSPTMPTGYNYKALVGAIRNDGGGDFINLHQVGNEIAIDVATAISGGTSGTRTSIDISAVIPSTAKRIYGYVLNETTGGGNTLNCKLYPKDSDLYELMIGMTPIGGTERLWQYYTLPIFESGTIYYLSANAGADATITSIYISGWSI
jgi:hypothetical protein